MGVYIRDMEKPKTCEDCPCAYFTEGAYTDECQVTHNHITDENPTDCPLIEIVECKDCKYWVDDMSGNMWCEHAIGGLTEPTDFCSKGERRADD